MPGPIPARPPTPDATSIVDNLIKQFAQSSQLGSNAAYIEDLYEQYLVSPDSVDPKWKTYFDGFKGREAGDVPHSASSPTSPRRPATPPLPVRPPPVAVTSASATSAA